MKYKAKVKHTFTKSDGGEGSKWRTTGYARRVREGMIALDLNMLQNENYFLFRDEENQNQWNLKSRGEWTGADGTVNTKWRQCGEGRDAKDGMIPLTLDLFPGTTVFLFPDDGDDSSGPPRKKSAPKKKVADDPYDVPF